MPGSTRLGTRRPGTRTLRRSSPISRYPESGTAVSPLRASVRPTRAPAPCYAPSGSRSTQWRPRRRGDVGHRGGEGELTGRVATLVADKSISTTPGLLRDRLALAHRQSPARGWPTPSGPPPPRNTRTFLREATPPARASWRVNSEGLTERKRDANLQKWFSEYFGTSRYLTTLINHRLGNDQGSRS
jgi:hypothetical protein